ncbi:hypothetical protein WA577_003509 [Blastocystis sp. JDR]
MIQSISSMFPIEGKYSEDLLSIGEHAIKGQNQVEQRAEVPYQSDFEPYVNKEISFNKQYNTLYEMRLKEMRSLLGDVVKQKWGDDVEVLKEIRLLQPNTECVIIGTTYKELSLFKSILNDKSSSAFNPQLIGTQFLPKSSLQATLSQENDPVVLEDSTTRVLLKGLQAPMVTGVVGAFRGMMNASGDFEVSDTCFLHDSVKPTACASSASSPKAPRLCCVSGLGIGETIPLPCHLLFEFLAAQTGFVEDAKLSARIVRVVLVGNSVAMPRLPFQRIRQDSKEIARTLQCVENLDLLLARLLPTTPLTVVPGASDPTPILVPQQPLHASLLQRSVAFSSLERAPNPYAATVAGKRVLMTAGQNVQDVLRQIAPAVSATEAMALTLQWGTLFPTDPNTCPGIPYDTTDPFIVRQLPDVYVVGNQAALEVERRVIGGKEVVLIALPAFSATGEAALVNLETLEVEPIRFEVEGAEKKEMEVEEKEEEEVVIDEDIANEDAE